MPFFSKSMIIKLDDMIHSKMEKLCSWTRDHRGANQPIDLGLGFRCLTTDVVTGYACAESYDLLDSSYLSPGWFRALRDSGPVALFDKHMPWLLPFMNSLPLWLVKILNPEMATSLAKSKIWTQLFQEVV